MNLKDVENRLLALFASSLHGEPVPEELISEAENKLGLIFPPSYRLFLKIYGAAALKGGPAIAGIQYPPKMDDNEPPSWSSVVQDTLMYRPNCAPENSIAISCDGMDMTYHLICSQSDPNYEGYIIEWGPGSDYKTPFATSFLDFCENFHELYMSRS